MKEGYGRRKAHGAMSVKDTDVKKGTITFVPSVFGNVDAGGDRVSKGSWAKTLRERASNIVMGYQHDLDLPLGMIQSGQEVGRDALTDDVRSQFPDATGGVELVGQVQPMTERNKERLEHIEVGNVKGASFYYDVLQWGYVEEDGRTIMDLKELRVFEAGPVTLGMNEAAYVGDLKSMFGSFSPLEILTELARRADTLDSELRKGAATPEQLTKGIASLATANAVLTNLLTESEPEVVTDEDNKSADEDHSEPVTARYSDSDIDDFEYGLMKTRAMLATIGDSR